MIKTNLTLFKFLLALVCSVFFIKALLFLDPDFGFQLQMGNFIRTHGIPYTDPFSYTMPSYSLVSHEWLLTVLLSILYPIVGMPGLALIWSIIAIASAYIAVYSVYSLNYKEARYFKLFLFISLMSVFYYYFGVRMQVISWLFFSMLLYLLVNFKKNAYSMLYGVLLFLVWANSHGSFVAGILIFFLYILNKYLFAKQLDKKMIVMFLLSIFITFINPYVLGNWIEVYMTFSDSSIKWRIQEWKPLFNFFPSFGYLFLMALAGSIIALKRRLIVSNYLLLALIVFFYFSVSSMRHGPIVSSISVVFILFEFDTFWKKTITNSLSKKRFVIATRFTLWFIVILNVGQSLVREPEAYSNYIKYPDAAIEYLKNNESGTIFSHYNWGGYLIWKYPEKKVFIDGRMPSWRREKSPQGELDFAMEDYIGIITGEKEFNDYFQKYNIDTVLLPASTRASGGRLISSYIKNDTKDGLHDKLVEKKWLKVYKDDIAIIYKKPQE